MQTIHFFAGGNTAEGFYSCFEHMLPRERRKRMFYLKGGPGVGKSTFMRRVGEAAEKAGLEVEYFHCSSDPDSLDGVCLPGRGVAMMDGTAPHVYDPAVPGARDTLLSLGDYLDETALRPHAREIEGVQADISARFARCYRYLAAAREVRLAAVRGKEDARKARDVAHAWAEGMPLRGGTAGVRRLFASAFTPKGLVQVLHDEPWEKKITLECPFGLTPTALLHETAKEAAMRGLHAVELLDPLSPGEIAHVVVPAQGLAFMTARAGGTGDGERIAPSVVFEVAAAGEKEESFDRNAYELLIQRATEQLAAAKALHDELESFYVGNMDFLKWQEMLDRVLNELELA